MSYIFTQNFTSDDLNLKYSPISDIILKIKKYLNTHASIYEILKVLCQENCDFYHTRRTRSLYPLLNYYLSCDFFEDLKFIIEEITFHYLPHYKIEAFNIIDLLNENFNKCILEDMGERG